MCIVAYSQPRRKIMPIFTAKYDTRWVTLVVFLISALRIIVSRNIKRSGVGRFIRHRYTRQACCYRPAAIVFFYHSNQAFGNIPQTHGVRCIFLITAIRGLGKTTFFFLAIQNRMGIGIIGIIHFIAYAPGKYRQVIPVPLNHIGQIPLPPLFKKVVSSLKTGYPCIPALQPLSLRKFPLIKCFIHDQQAQLIT
ncbi:hypothetical protein D3C81_960060 [compost metagenome]